MGTSYYFAYGSNMHFGRMIERLSRVRFLETAILGEHTIRFHKLGRDGSGKCNVVADRERHVAGAIYRLETKALSRLDRIEGRGYRRMPIVVRGTMKPISTLLKGLPSVDLNTREADHSAYERSDVCALPAASVVMENVVGFEIARAFMDKFAGDTLPELRASYDAYLDLARRLPLEPPAAAARMERDQTEA